MPVVIGPTCMTHLHPGLGSVLRCVTPRHAASKIPWQNARIGKEMAEIGDWSNLMTRGGPKPTRHTHHWAPSGAPSSMRPPKKGRLASFGTFCIMQTSEKKIRHFDFRRFFSTPGPPVDHWKTEFQKTLKNASKPFSNWTLSWRTHPAIRGLRF